MPEIDATPAAEPSMGDLRAMIAGSPTEPKPDTPEPVKAEPVTEAVQEPAETKQEPKEDEPLPEGVRKRIEKEVSKQAEYDRLINEARSTTKAKEAEAAKLTATGSQPATTSAAASKAPVHGESGHEEETWGEFHVREREFERAEIRAEIKAEFEQERLSAARKVAREAGIKGQIEAGTVKDAAEFDSLAEQVEAVAPPEMQRVISHLSNWAGVAAHLARHPAQLKELSAAYADNPVEVIATLGNIQAGLKSKATKAAADAKPLPEPPVKEGGTATATAGAFDYENASMSQMRRKLGKVAA